jgi:hypothetical protein
VSDPNATLTGRFTIGRPKATVFMANKLNFWILWELKKIYVRFFDVSYNEVQGPVPVGELSYLGSGSTQGREITGEPITG